MIFTTILACVSLLGYSQVTWDARIGTNVSGFSEGDLQMKTGLKAAIGIKYAFGDWFALRPAVGFSMKGATKSDKRFGFNPDEAYRLSYIDIPVLAAFRFPLTSGFSLALNAGPYATFLVNKNTFITANDIRKVDTGLQAGVDFLIHRFVIGAEAQYGFVKLSDTAGAPHTITYSFMIGYRF